MSASHAEVCEPEYARLIDGIPAILRAGSETNARLPSERRSLTSRVERNAWVLQRTTKWDEETLLRRLGCRVGAVTRVEEMSTAELEACSIFLETVSDATSLVSTDLDRRQVVSECASLLHVVHEAAVPNRLLSREELEEYALRAARELDRQLREAPAGALSPFDYVRLGEIDAAGSLVRQRYGQEHPVTANPYHAAATVHLSEERIDMFLDGDRDLLGDEVYDFIEVHLTLCKACRDAVAFCRRVAPDRPEHALTS